MSPHLVLRVFCRFLFLCCLVRISLVMADDNPHVASHSKQTEFISSAPQLEEPSGDLTLPQALALALLKNPELAAFSSEVRAQEAAILQAGLLPNPVFGANAGNFGNRVIRGFDGDVVTLQLSQLIELGGKRAARTQTAELTKKLSEWDYETKRVDLYTGVTIAFIDVLSAQQRLTLTKQMQELSRQMLTTTSARVQAGKVSPVEESKAKIALASAQIEYQRSQRELDAARKRLAATWASPEPRFVQAKGSLENEQTPPNLDSLNKRINDNPDLARWATEITQRQSMVSMEQTKAIPDVTFTVGGSKYLQNNDYALMVGVSVPLPVFDRNQGRIQEAEQRLTKAENEQQSAEIRVKTALNSAYQRLSTAFTETNMLHQDILPNAESAYNAATIGYRYGKFGILDVLDAQRTLFSTQSQHLLASAEYHKALAEVERLIGGSLSQTTQSTKIKTGS